MEYATSYVLTRFVFQRALALVYVIAFLAIINQFKPLLGERGLLPVPQFLRLVKFSQTPSLFFWSATNTTFLAFGWAGLILSLIALSGISERLGTPVSLIIWGLLWFIYLSFVNVGQTFYSFGWESMLLETGFLAIFLGAADTAPPVIVIWLLRWVLFRNMFGAGLIKLRGDECWKDLTCLYYHYETQPIPNPLSWFFHWLPKWVHRSGVLFNHFAELIVPFGLFAPQLFATIAGVFTLIFHGLLTISGNFAFLGFLTLVLTIPTFDDRLLGLVLPFRVTANTVALSWHTYATWGLAALVTILSFKPVANILSPRQMMNTSFDPLHLVNTYGAFGSITRPRFEVVVEGTTDKVVTASTPWQEYEFKGKPTKLNQLPRQIAPYHLRLDWLMWFLALSAAEGSPPQWQHPWFINFVGKLLQNDPDTLGLLAKNPFPGEPPTYVRALLYRYEFTAPEERKKTGNWWTRELLRIYVPPAKLNSRF